MLVHVYSLKKPVFHAEAKSVNAKTVSGEITVLDNHRPLIIPLSQDGALRIVPTAGAEHVFDYHGGFLDVRPAPPAGGEVNVLVD